MKGDWPRVALAEIQAQKKWALNGGPFGSKLVSRDYRPTGVPVIRGVNLASDSRFSFDDLVFVSEEKANELLPNNAHPGDVVFTQRGTLGQVGLIPRDCGYDRFVISQSQMKLTVDESKADPLYLYYYFRAPSTVQAIQNLGISSGVPHINLDLLRKFEVVLPPLAVQHRIARVLSAYDDLIENNTRRIAILEEMAQAIYREWFVHFRFPGHEQEVMVESELGPIPEGWAVVRLGDIAQEVRRSVDPATIDPETPYFGLEHLPRKSIALSDWGRAREVQSTKLRFRKGDILFGKIRPYFHKVGIAPVDGICSTDTIVIVPKSDKYRMFVLSYVSSEAFVAHATQTAQGTKMPRADWKVLVQHPVVVPPDELLARFENLCSDIVRLIQNLILRNRNLRQTRDLLLPKLISGEIDVEALESEPVGAVA